MKIDFDGITESSTFEENDLYFAAKISFKGSSMKDAYIWFLIYADGTVSVQSCFRFPEYYTDINPGMLFLNDTREFEINVPAKEQFDLFYMVEKLFYLLCEVIHQRPISEVACDKTVLDLAMKYIVGKKEVSA